MGKIRRRSLQGMYRLGEKSPEVRKSGGPVVLMNRKWPAPGDPYSRDFRTSGLPDFRTLFSPHLEHDSRYRGDNIDRVAIFVDVLVMAGNWTRAPFSTSTNLVLDVQHGGAVQRQEELLRADRMRPADAAAAGQHGDVVDLHALEVNRRDRRAT